MKRLIILALVAGLALIAVGCEVNGPGQTNQAVTASGAIAGQYLVKFRPGAGAAAHSAARAAGGSVVLDLPKHDLFAAHLPAAALNGLSHDPSIEYIEPDPVRYPMAQTIPYGVQMVNSPATLALGNNPGNRTVCIIDSGFDLGHEDLPSNVSGSLIGNGLAWDQDSCGHGSHVAGTIAAVDNSLGVIGVAPGVNLHIVRVFGGNSTDAECGWTSGATLIDALDACVAAGANVVSMSLGGTMKSRSEDVAFAQAYSQGLLPIAAAGNDGNTRKSFPASYDAVISVAAIDESKTVASFSQQNSAVELAAPGVGVLSTVPMGSGLAATLTPDYAVEPMDGSPLSSGATGALFDCGDATNGCAGATGKVCLIQRGTIAFSDKVLACQDGGGIAAIIYNNEPGMLLGTLGGVATNIPSVGTSDTDGAALEANYLGQNVTLAIAPSNYAAWDGTSMATPHVSAAAALVWSGDTNCTPDQIRTALTSTAEDLGAAGRDPAYGFGLVDAFAAANALDCGGTPPPPSGCTSDADCASGEVCNTSTGVCETAPSSGCTSDADCASGEVCNTSTGVCETSSTGPNDCSAGTDMTTGCSCTDDSQCYFGKCKGRPGRQTCN